MKRIVSVLCAFLILLVFCLTLCVHAGDLPPVTLVSRIAGDVNGDRSVGLLDVTVLARHLAGGWNITINDKNADVNGDNTVDLKDVVLIRRYLAGGWNVKLQ